MGAHYSLSGDSREVTNPTIDTSSVNITLPVKSSDKAATVHGLDVKWERTKLQNSKHSSYSKQLESHISAGAKC